MSFISKMLNKYKFSQKAIKAELIPLYWVRPKIDPAPGAVEAYINSYCSAENFEDRQKIVDDWLAGGAVYIGYTLPGSSTLLAKDGERSQFTLQSGDVSYDRKSFQYWVDHQHPIQ